MIDLIIDHPEPLDNCTDGHLHIRQRLPMSFEQRNSSCGLTTVRQVPYLAPQRIHIRRQRLNPLIATFRQ